MTNPTARIAASANETFAAASYVITEPSQDALRPPVEGTVVLRAGTQPAAALQALIACLRAAEGTGTRALTVQCGLGYIVDTLQRHADLPPQSRWKKTDGTDFANRELFEEVEGLMTRISVQISLGRKGAKEMRRVSQLAKEARASAMAAAQE